MLLPQVHPALDTHFADRREVGKSAVTSTVKGLKTLYMNCGSRHGMLLLWRSRLPGE